MTDPDAGPTAGRTADERVREWHDGHPVAPDDLGWALAVTGSLGCAFTVRIPAGARDHAPVVAARARASEVATLLGAVLDEAPWQALLDAPVGTAPVEVDGVWEPQFRGPLGAARTRITSCPDATPRDRTARWVRLPWTYGSSTAVAGLAVPTPHEDSLAETHLARTGVEVGLWCDHRDVVCTSTAGPLLLRTAEGSWLHPSPSCGAVGHWLHDRFVTALGSSPANLAAEGTAVAAPPGASLWAVDAWGSLTSLTTRPTSAADGTTHRSAEAALRDLQALRTELLPFA